MSKTGEGLAEYGKDRLGMPYFYGAKISNGPLTEKYMQTMHSMYPSTVTADYMKKAKNRGQVGKINTDCSGLIAGYRGINKGSAQLYQTAYLRMPIADIKKFAPGVVLWKPGHVGIYLGIINGVPMCCEAKGINYGTVMTKVSATKWTSGLTFSDIAYNYADKVDGKWKGINPYTEPLELLYYNKYKVKEVSEGVKWLQWELCEAGYKLEIDGRFGLKTKAALGDLQASCKIKKDYICGPSTREYLK